MLSLVVQRENEILRFPIVEGESRIGAGPENDIVLPYSGVSRTHAVLVRSGRDVFVVDSESKNGLYLGRQRVERVPLVSGVSVGLGSVLVSVKAEETGDLLIDARLKVSAPEQSGPLGSTETIEEDGNVSATRMLAFLRRYERAGKDLPSKQRSAFLGEACRLLEAETFAICEGPPALARIQLLVGSPITGGHLENILARLVSTTTGTGVVCIRMGLDTYLVARPGSEASSPTGVAAFRRAVPRPGSWRWDLCSYVCEKVLGGGGGDGYRVPADPVMAEATAPQELRLPDGMVVGSSPSMAALLEEVRATLNSRLDVLLLGETGVGKELFARMIHASWPESSGPFISVNCAAIPSDLFEAELFGILPRSATGVEGRPGHFIRADGGTIFLDEVGELAGSLQAKLLRVLQEREVLPVGASVPRRLNVRVISASNRDLRADVEMGRFRADLYYRLRGLQFHVPPLRERKEDMPALVLAFVERAAREYGKVVRGVSEKAIDLLTKHDWPGNVRELETDLRRAVLICPANDFLRTEHFTLAGWVAQARPAPRGPEDTSGPGVVVQRPGAGNVCGRAAEGAAEAGPTTLRERLEATERSAIEEAVSRTKGNQTAAARLLGITRNGLALKLARLRRTLNRAERAETSTPLSDGADAG